MAPPSTPSNSEDKPPPPPLTFEHCDAELYKYLRQHHQVIDGITRGKVDGNTTLATLYEYDEPGVDNTLVRNFAGVAEPKVPCQVQVGDGKCFPPSTAGEKGYRFQVSYNKLCFAPTLRLEYIITARQKDLIRPLPSCAIEFHFNEYIEGEENAIRDYQHDTKHGIIRFQAGRATCSGFNIVSKPCSEAPHKYAAVMKVLKSFVTAKGERFGVTLYLSEDGLSDIEKEDLDFVRTRLPGGAGPLIPTIGTVEYKPFGPDMDHTHALRGSERWPRSLMDHAAPFPFVSLECGTTFSTPKEAGVQLSGSATVVEAESREALKLWAAAQHTGQLFLLDKSVVFGIKFGNYRKLGGPKDDLNFRLPRELSCNFLVPESDKEDLWSLVGFLMSSHPGGSIPRHDAFFEITSHPLKFFQDKYQDQEPPVFDFVSCSPHINAFTYSMQLETVKQLQQQRNARWHGILLNQVHDVLKIVDMTHCTDPIARREADAWLMNWMEWNAEQLKVIKGIRAAKGGIIVVMGPAATGKTLLQRALAIYFYFMGFHILALAPANDNANKMTRDMLSTKNLPVDVKFLRLYPGSRDLAIAEMTDDQRSRLIVGHEDGSSLPFPELLIALDEHGKPKEDHRKCGVVETVINTADDRKLKLFKRVRKENGKSLPDDVDAWDILREFIQKYRERKVDWAGNFEQYRLAYLACKGHIVGLNRFMITTTGNVQSMEMVYHWFNEIADYGIPRKGVVVFVDEAAKDLEVNVWSGIVCEKWSEWVKGVFLFGDDKQLQPPNTSSKRNVKFNCYSDRLDMSLPSRLVREGFPYYQLVQQRRMHRVLSSYPNRKIYHGKLRDGPGMDVPLENQMPGLSQVLKDIISSTFRHDQNRQFWLTNVKDDDLRRHHVQVDGERIKHPSTKSMAVLEHVDVFFEKLYPRLEMYFREIGRSIHQEVMIICAYNHQRSIYLERFRALREQDTNLTERDQPRVLTIDSSQGDESFMVFLDGSAQQGHAIGHMKEECRFNVAVTRAKGVLWTIGGRMLTPRKFAHVPLYLATEYKRELDAARQSHYFSVLD